MGLGNGNYKEGNQKSNWKYEYDVLKLLDAIRQGVISLSIANTSQSSIVAHAGGGQANATQLTALYNRVDTVASNGDSVKVKWAVLNDRQVIQNNGANDLDVYPLPGDKFLGQAINTPYTVSAGNELAIYCYVTGEWTPQ